jgi:uncharacterized NAD-dependent epimerase/dehydratase family protein
MDGRSIGIPVIPTLDVVDDPPDVFVVGVAFSGGRLPDDCRDEIRGALRRGMTVVCGLHHLLGDDPEFRELAERHGGRLVDIRRPRPVADLRFWTGDVLHIGAKVVGVLGTDCAVGKRTTSRFLMEACREAGIRTEMVYTGQTGWMQGYPHGFIFDATPNDFVSGELERVLLECDRARSPELILVEGQGSLRNPSGPCGSEIIVSGNARGVVLQHAPARTHFIDHEDTGFRVPSVEDEIALIGMYGAEVLAVTLNEEGWDMDELSAYASALAGRIARPVVAPLSEGVDSLVPVLSNYLGS